MQEHIWASGAERLLKAVQKRKKLEEEKLCYDEDKKLSQEHYALYKEWKEKKIFV